MLLQKQRTIDDVLACAQELTARKISTPATLAVEGSSAGGVAARGALVQRPELFGAVLLRVGLLDTLRIEQSENVFNVGEFGSTKTDDGFRALYGADAYLHVQDGARYPSVLLTTGVNDPRVAPWMVTKMAARLQAASASGKPVLLRVSFTGGHFATGQEDEEDEFADEYAFLLHELSHKT
jgi:prolyl oligopeptidase